MSSIIPFTPGHFDKSVSSLPSYKSKSVTLNCFGEVFVHCRYVEALANCEERDVSEQADAATDLGQKAVQHIPSHAAREKAG